MVMNHMTTVVMLTDNGQMSQNFRQILDSEQSGCFRSFPTVLPQAE